ncbi:putative Cystatin domain-containing protein [Medicago truncatula]|uniref:Phloem filament protein PP1 n=1 Tax=Medicago truncatula TaxID=3880 RepID=G7K0N3_MEDTR|nr:cysteine proteinase inhibitor 1 [Medicago truncatula]AET01018.1 phloem filament protein PP1 [Medicago truncatula]RHN58175.1 putative Cystatin domain-containing protein [Medicago truncatula]
MKLQLFVLFVVLMSYADARKQPLSDGWSRIKDINNPHVIDIANFAVIEFNKQTGAKLKFEKVIKGESRLALAEDAIYRLIISTSNSVPNIFQAVVIENKLNHDRNLTSFILTH